MHKREAAGINDAGEGSCGEERAEFVKQFSDALAL